MLKINTDKQPKIADKYGVDGLPNLMILDSKGNKIGFFMGFFEAPEYIAEATKIMKAAKKKKKD